MPPWLCAIEPPTVLYWPLKLMSPVFCTVMVRERAVIAAVLLSFSPSSSKKAPLELMTGVTVTPPVPVPGEFTTREIVARWVRVPLTPVMVRVAGPVAAAADEVRVSVLVPVVAAGLKLAVTPAGSPLTLRETVPAKPPLRETIIVAEALAPRVTDKLAGLADRAKSGVP